MLTKTIARVLVGAVVAVAAAGCPDKHVKPDRGDDAYAKPVFEYRGIKFENQSFSSTDVTFRFELASKDARSATVKDCPYKIEFEGAEAVQGTVTPGPELAGPGSLEVVSTVSVPWPKEKDEVQAFLGRKRLPYKFLQDCNLTTPDGPMTVSASDSGSVPLPKLPELTVSGANAERFTGTELRINFEMSFINENSFHVKIGMITYKITVEGRVLAEGKMAVVESIAPSNEASYDISSGMLSGEQKKEINEMIKKPSLEYHLEGNVTMGDFEIPVDASGTISFPR